jgi:hypothetical protein
MGLSYLLLKQGLDNRSPVQKAFLFGGVIFGIDWVLFNLFPLLAIDMSPVELLVLAGSDIALLILGVFFYERFIARTPP